MTVSIAEGNRRLLVLAEFLEKLPPARFDYANWVRDDWQGKPDLSCGTKACALGWATTIPEFQSLGLQLLRQNDDLGVVFADNIPEELDGYQDSIDSAERLFGIEGYDAKVLFTPEGAGLGNRARPATVARHIRKFVAGRASK